MATRGGEYGGQAEGQDHLGGYHHELHVSLPPHAPPCQGVSLSIPVAPIQIFIHLCAHSFMYSFIRFTRSRVLLADLSIIAKGSENETGVCLSLPQHSSTL